MPYLTVYNDNIRTKIKHFDVNLQVGSKAFWLACSLAVNVSFFIAIGDLTIYIFFIMGIVTKISRFLVLSLYCVNVLKMKKFLYTLISFDQVLF